MWAEFERADKATDAAFKAAEVYEFARRLDAGYAALWARAEEANENAWELLQRIGPVPTRTLAGVQVKARAMHWLLSHQMIMEPRDVVFTETLVEALEALHA
jgi:hypothetical protein